MNLININNLGNTLEMLTKRAKDFIITESSPKGVTDLRLSIIGEETLSADCDVTDHYVESNTAYQDQISLKPKIYTIQGEVGELVWYQRDPIEQGIGQVSQRLEGIISFLPKRSKKFNQMKGKVMKALQWVDTASNAIDKINKLASSEGNAQQQAYSFLMKLRQDRTPISVKTPWGQLDDYVITNLKLTQPKETRDKTLISITLKEFRMTSVKPVPFDFSKYQGNAAFEAQPKVENGTTSGANADNPNFTESMRDEKQFAKFFPEGSHYDIQMGENEDFAVGTEITKGEINTKTGLKAFYKLDTTWYEAPQYSESWKEVTDEYINGIWYSIGEI